MLLEKSNLVSALAVLADGADVFVPGEHGSDSRFVLWNGKSGVDLTGDNTAFPPKDILFPKTEKMYAYKSGQDAQVKEIHEDRKQILFGIRPCDVESITRLDQVFSEKEFRDEFYLRKRANATLIAIACEKPQRTCFCDSMGLSPNAAPSADVLLSDNGDSYGVTAQTDKGKEIVERLKSVLKKGDGKPGKAACTLKAKMDDKTSEKLSVMFENPIWEKVTRACIGCATCTYVCPTCYCFDISTECRGNEGVNFRCWDSCMFSEYSRMAGGHNPRPSKKERLRNRYLHKLSYFKDRHGSQLCVGCGRCVGKCPAHLDITEFIDQAAEVTL